jgi:hypothetical protein
MLHHNKVFRGVSGHHRRWRPECLLAFVCDGGAAQ